MNKPRILHMLLVFALIFAMAPWGSYVQAESISPFTDVKDSHWALQHILKLQLRGVVNGYGTGDFRPNQAVTQLEAVTMAVRAMGLAAETDTVDKSKISDMGWSLPTSWNAAGYVAVAVEKKLIDTNNFSPTMAAYRAWFAQLVVRMIDAEDEVTANAKTTFYDDATIPLWSKGFVQLAVEKEIITGLKDGDNLIYAPYQSVSRAQIVTMISRTDSFLSDVNGQLPTATIVSVRGQQMELINSKNEKFTYTLSTQLASYNAIEERIAASGLKQGNSIRYGLDQSGQIVFIEQLSEAVQTKTTGKIAQHFPNDRLLTVQDQNGKLTIYPYTELTKITSKSGATIEASSLKVGEEVALSFGPNDTLLAIELQSQTAATLNSGTIYSIDLETGILTLESNGRYKAYTLAEAVSVVYEGLRFPSVKDLQKGDEIELTVGEGEKITGILLIKPFQNQTITGKVEVISATGQIVTLRLEDNSLKALEFSTQAKLLIEGMTNPTFSDIKANDNVNVIVESGKITQLTVTNRAYLNELNGTVKTIDTINRYLTIENSKGELITHPIDPYVVLELDKANPRLQDILIGMKVTLKLKENTIYSVSINNTVEGKFVRLGDRNAFITIETPQRESLTYRLVTNVDVQINNDTTPVLTDLKTGDSLIITTSQDFVTRIFVKTSGVHKIKEVNTTNDRITINIGGVDRTYTVFDTTVLTIPGITQPKIEDVEAGDMVRLAFTGWMLDSLEVIQPTYGTIDSIESYRNTIVVSSMGQQERIVLDATAKLFNHEGRSITLSQLRVGDYLKIVKAGSEIYVTQTLKVQAKVGVVNIEKGQILAIDPTGVYLFFNFGEDMRVWKGSADYRLSDLVEDQSITLYVLDLKVVGISVK